MDFFGIGVWEVLFILILVLIIFGPGKMTHYAREMGKGIRKLQKAYENYKAELDREIDSTGIKDVQKDLQEIKQDITPGGIKDLKELKQDITPGGIKDLKELKQDITPGGIKDLKELKQNIGSLKLGKK